MESRAASHVNFAWSQWNRVECERLPHIILRYMSRRFHRISLIFFRVHCPTAQTNAGEKNIHRIIIINIRIRTTRTGDRSIYAVLQQFFIKVMRVKPGRKVKKWNNENAYGGLIEESTAHHNCSAIWLRNDFFSVVRSCLVRNENFIFVYSTLMAAGSVVYHAQILISLRTRY